MNINSILTYFNIFLFLTIFVNPVDAQNNAKQITKEFKQVMIRDSLPGMAVVMVSKNRLIYKKCFGYADISANRPYALKTTQEIGSVSKMILAVSLMKAIELGYFTLETDINTILPFKVINPFEPTHAITIRELASHTSGIIDKQSIYMNTYRFNFELRPYDTAFLKPMNAFGYRQPLRDSSISKFLFNYLVQAGNYFSPDNFVYNKGGRTFVYSNIATTLIAYLIEIKSGMSYKEFTSIHIFRPLHMNHSSWFLSELNLNNQAQLYFNSKVKIPLYDLLTYPDGGLKTNAIDLSKFLMDMMNGLSGKSAILKPDSFRVMFTPQFSNLDKPVGVNLMKRNKGILWNLYANGTIGHDGDDPGISSFIVFNPSTGLGGLFLCNKYIDDKGSLTDIITKAISKF